MIQIEAVSDLQAKTKMNVETILKILNFELRTILRIFGFVSNNDNSRFCLWQMRKQKTGDISYVASGVGRRQR